MDRTSGWIKIDRKILEWEWYTDANTMRLFFHLILKANNRDGRFKGVDVKRGQLVTSYGNLSKELKLSVKEVRTALNHLKWTGEVASQSYHDFTLITVVNYGKYQTRTASQGAGNGQPEGKQGASQGQQSKNIRNKEIKKENKQKKESSEKSVPEPETRRLPKWWEVNNIPAKFWGKFEDEDSFWAWRAEHPDD